MTQALLSQLPSSAVLQQPLLDRNPLASQVLTSLSQQLGQMLVIVGTSGVGRTVFLSQFAKLWQEYRSGEQVLQLDFAELAKQDKQAASAGLMSTVMALKSDLNPKVVCCDSLEALAYSSELGWLVQWALDELSQAAHLRLVLVMHETLYHERFSSQQSFQLDPATQAQTSFLIKAYLKHNEVAQWLNLAPDFVGSLLESADGVSGRGLPGAAFDVLAVILRDYASKSGVVGANEVSSAAKQFLPASQEMVAKQPEKVEQLALLAEALPVYADQVNQLESYLRRDVSARPPLVCLHGEQVELLSEFTEALQQCLNRLDEAPVSLSVETESLQQLEQLIISQPSLIVLTDLHLADDEQLQTLFELLASEPIQAALSQTLLVGVFIESMPIANSAGLLQLVVTDMPQPVAAAPSTLKSSLSDRYLAKTCSIELCL